MKRQGSKKHSCQETAKDRLIDSTKVGGGEKDG